MSPSARKDVFQAVGIRPVPPNLSKEEFYAKIEAFVEDALLLPIVQKNLLKMEVLFQTDRFDDHVHLYGFTPREPVVVIVAQAESADNMIAVLSDPEVQKKFQGSRQSSLQKGARVFATELVPQIDGPARERSTVRMLSFYSVPRHLSTDDYETKFQTLLEKYVALPVVQKNLTCGELVRRSLTSAYRATIWHCFKWLQNYTLDDYLLALGHSAPKPTFVLYAESENWEKVMECMNDPEAQKLLQEGEQDFDFNTEAACFTVDVMTKLDRF